MPLFTGKLDMLDLVEVEYFILYSDSWILFRTDLGKPVDDDLAHRTRFSKSE